MKQYNIKTILIGNKKYIICSDDNYILQIGNNFEPYMCALFSILIEKKDVVADIGANIGLTTLLFSSIAEYVYAFEPSLTTFNFLKMNISNSNITNVDLYNIGLGNEKRTAKITFAANNRSGGFVSDLIRPEQDHVTEEIKIVTIDDFYQNKKLIPTFLKLDVEGFEQNVIKGGKEFIQKYNPTIVLELNHFCLSVLHRITVPDFFDFLRSIFPILYAVDSDNKQILNLHISDHAYTVMHEHVVKHRFPNIVAGFDQTIESKLNKLQEM